MRIIKTATTRALITPNLKNQNEAISNSVDLFYRQFVAQRGLPFEGQVHNEKTIKAIRNSRSGKGEKFSTSQEFFKNLGI